MKTNRTFSNAMAALVAIVGLVAVSCQTPRVATGETDDLYFNSKDRMQVRYASDVATASNRTGNNGSLNYYSQSESGGVELQPEGTPSQQAQVAADYYNPTYQMSAPMVDGTNRRTSSGGDTYITHNHYDSWSRNAFPGWGFQPVLGIATFSPWGWGYNPWFGPRYRLWGRPGWNISIGYGWGWNAGWGMGMGWGMPMGMGWGFDPFWGPGIGMGMGWGFDPFWRPGMGWGWGGYDPFFNPYYRPGWGWGGNGMQPGNPSIPINPNRNPVVVGPRGRTGSNNVTSVSSVGPNSNNRMPSRQQLTSNGGGQAGSDAGSGRIPATSRPPSRNEVNTGNYSFNETTAPTRGNRESLGGGETTAPIGGRQSTSSSVPKQYESGTTPSSYTNTRPGGIGTAVPSSPDAPRRADAMSGFSNSPTPSRDNNGSTNYYQRERSQMRNSDAFTSPSRESRSNWSTPSPSNSGGSFGTRDRGSFSSPSPPSRGSFSSPSPSPRFSNPSPSSGGGRSNFGGGGNSGGGGSRMPSRPR